MHRGFRRVLGVVAIVAITLQTALWGGTTTHASATTFDPFSVICHSGGNVDAASDQTPTSPVSVPGHACDHCNLCSAAPAPAVSPAGVVVRLLPNRLSRVLEPVSIVPRARLEVSLKGPRAPPVYV